MVKANMWIALTLTCVQVGCPVGGDMPDLLARVALAKEGNDADAAHQALTVFNAVGQEHIKQVKCLDEKGADVIQIFL
jgi:hypothetical protein